MPYAIGIDLGGTNVKILAVDAGGRELLHDRFATEDQPTAAYAQRIARRIQAMESPAPAQWIGLAAPGLAAPDGRSIQWMRGRMEALQGLDWSAYLQRPVAVLNDGHAALLGELWQGAARGARNAVMLTLGTGVGGAVVCDGRLLKGALGRAGHLGHISLDADGPRDIVNTPGSLEEAIGECTLARRCHGSYPSTRDLVQAYLAGDRQAAEVWLKSVRALAVGIASIINAVDPEIVLLAGGISQAGAALLDPLGKYLDEFEWRPTEQKVSVVLAALGDRAGALGAAWNAMTPEAQR